MCGRRACSNLSDLAYGSWDEDAVDARIGDGGNDAALGSILAYGGGCIVCLRNALYSLSGLGFCC